MEKNYKNKEKSFGYDSFQKIFLLSRYLEEPKVQKDWFTGQFQKYMLTIKHDVDNITKDVKYDRLKKEPNSNSYFPKRNSFYSDKKYAYILPITKGNKFYLKKITKNYLNNYSNNIEEITKNESSINLDSINEYKNKTINTNVNKSMDTNVSDEIKKHKFNFKYELSTLPNIQTVGKKKKYITKYIKNISEKTDSLEKKLLRQERMKYFGFKSKYNKLFNEYKKVQIDIDQYVNPQKNKRYKFDLDKSGDKVNAKGDITKVMRLISNKLKNKYENKPSILDIINEVDKFKFREKRLRERIKRNHDKFDYLINDSNIIQKRIDIKCQKNTQI